MKNIHLAAKDISQVYSELGIPMILTYPYWFLYLFYLKIKTETVKMARKTV